MYPGSVLTLKLKVADIVKVLEADKEKTQKRYDQARKKWEKDLDKYEKLVSQERNPMLPPPPSKMALERIDSLIEMFRFHQLPTVEMSFPEYSEMRGLGNRWGRRGMSEYLAPGTCSVEEYVGEEALLKEQVEEAVQEELEQGS
jgi:hypothetical protein